MLANIVYIDIADRTYPMSFSLGAMAQMKGYRQAVNQIKENKDIAQAAEMVISMLYSMIHSGCEYMNIMHLPAKGKIPTNEVGEIIPITDREIRILVEATEENMKYIMNKIELCIGKSNQKDIQAVSRSDSKKKKKRH